MHLRLVSDEDVRHLQGCALFVRQSHGFLDAVFVQRPVVDHVMPCNSVNPFFMCFARRHARIVILHDVLFPALFRNLCSHHGDRRVDRIVVDRDRAGQQALVMANSNLCLRRAQAKNRIRGCGV